jgi:hypothetical protein
MFLCDGVNDANDWESIHGQSRFAGEKPGGAAFLLLPVRRIKDVNDLHVLCFSKEFPEGFI